MIVVSNTSPIMNLVAIGQINLLKQLYGEIFIPKTVLQELSIIHKEQLSERYLWIKTQPVINQNMVDVLLLELDKGEAEAIALAIEMKADLLLLDERRARKIASHLGLRFIGLLGILIEAKRKMFIFSVKPLLDEMIAKAGFWVDKKLYERFLKETEE
ncbi:MAG: DUF3368 domain-containing protein [bacterium]